MQFLVLAYDHKDDGAPARRMEAREQHLAAIARYKEAGNLHIAGALTDASGKMVGSCIIVDFPSRQELSAWLAEDPYTVNKVWDEIQIQDMKLAPAFQKAG